MKVRTLTLVIGFFLLSPASRAQTRADLERRILDYARDGGGRIGVAAKNLRTGEIVALNADSLFPTASVIKLPILVELFADRKSVV